METNISTNSDPNQMNEIVEFTPAGKFIKELSIDPTEGATFGIDIYVSGGVAKLATVDDSTSKLLIWSIPVK